MTSLKKFDPGHEIMKQRRVQSNQDTSPPKTPTDGSQTQNMLAIVFLQPIVQGLSRAHRYVLSGFSPRFSAEIGCLPSVSTEKRDEVEAVCCCHSDKEYTYYTYYTYDIYIYI